MQLITASGITVFLFDMMYRNLTSVEVPLYHPHFFFFSFLFFVIFLYPVSFLNIIFPYIISTHIEHHTE